MHYAIKNAPSERRGSAPETGRFRADTQLNWLARYLPLVSHLGDADRRSLLEVGSGARGIGSVLDTPFVGLDVAFAAPPAPPMRSIAYAGKRFPFKPAAFHTVVSLDTLEHVPAPARPGFITELTRVASARILIGFPADALAIAIDRYLQSLLPRIERQTPDWLHEHEEHGMPRAVDIESLFHGLTGWQWRTVPTTGTLPCLLLLLADVLPGIRQWVAPLLETHGDAMARWIETGAFGPSFRKVYVLERDHAHEPLIDLHAPETLYAGLACPRCDGDVAPCDDRAAPRGDRAPEDPRGPLASGSKAAVACPRCDLRFGTDVNGVLAMVAPPSDKPAPVAFVLEAGGIGDTQWIAAARNYLAAFTPADGCLLWLKLDPRILAVEKALALLEPMVATYGDAPFPDIALSDDPAERPAHARVIALPPMGPELARWTPGEFRARARSADAG